MRVMVYRSRLSANEGVPRVSYTCSMYSEAYSEAVFFVSEKEIGEGMTSLCIYTESFTRGTLETGLFDSAKTREA